MDLARALLDKQVMDRDGRKLGKVDSVLLVLSESGPPRVAAIELGLAAVAHRITPRLGRWLDATARRWRLPIGRTRVPWPRITRTGVDIDVDLDGERVRAHALERWLRRHVIARIPGSGS